jgi:hypothetical protein
MSDGNEEREETKKRRDQLKKEDQDDRVVRGDPDEWQPERPDS